MDFPPTNSRVRVIYRIDAAADGPARARRIVRSECSTRVTRGTLDKLQLLVSELVTHGIVHRREATDASLLLDIGLNSTLRCAVVDHGSAFIVGASSTPRDQERAWGLRLVERLADRWGVQHTRNGTRVWFETATA